MSAPTDSVEDSFFFELYREAWSGHLPASRWDSDGRWVVTEVRNLGDSLAAQPSEPQLPHWVEALLEGYWERASVAAGDSPPAPERRNLAALLGGARVAARREGGWRHTR